MSFICGVTINRIKTMSYIISRLVWHSKDTLDGTVWMAEWSGRLSVGESEAR